MSSRVRTPPFASLLIVIFDSLAFCGAAQKARVKSGVVAAHEMCNLGDDSTLIASAASVPASLPLVQRTRVYTARWFPLLAVLVALLVLSTTYMRHVAHVRRSKFRVSFKLARANRILSQVHKGLARESAADAALRYMLLEISNLMEAGAALVSRFDESSLTLRATSSLTEGDIPPPLPAAAKPALTQHPIIVRLGTGHDESLPFLEWHMKRGHRVVMQSGLSADGTLLGLLTVGFTHHASPSSAQQQMFHALAQKATLALQAGKIAEENMRSSMVREREQAVARERARIAREVHDTLAQSFSGIVLHLRAMCDARVLGHRHDVERHSELATELAQLGLAEARRALYALRPAALEGRSLYEALHSLAETTSRRSGLNVAADLSPGIALSPPHETEVLRIVQEAVANAIKHSGTTSVRIALLQDREGNREVTIQDYGRGFDPERTTEGLGLVSMRERAARISGVLEIRSSAAGTTLCLRLAPELKSA